MAPARAAISHARKELKEGVSRKGVPLTTAEQYAARISVLQVYSTGLRDGHHREALVADIAKAEVRRQKLLDAAMASNNAAASDLDLATERLDEGMSIISSARRLVCASVAICVCASRPAFWLVRLAGPVFWFSCAVYQTRVVCSCLPSAFPSRGRYCTSGA